MEPKEINTFFFFQYVTFPLFSYYKSRKSNKNQIIMTYNRNALTVGIRLDGT